MTLPAELTSPPELPVVCACRFCGTELVEGVHGLRYRDDLAGVHIYCNAECLVNQLILHDEVEQGPVEFLACGYPSAPDTTWERDER